MNPDAPLTPREQTELRVTALLMGELSAEEAAEVQAQIAADAELAALYQRLRHASELLREASALSDSTASPTPARLSSERRERLLAHFKGATPEPVVVIVPPRDWRWVVPLGLAASLIALLGGTVLMNGFALSVHRQFAASPDFAAQSGLIDLSEKAAPEERVRKEKRNWLFATRGGTLDLPVPSSEAASSAYFYDGSTAAPAAEPAPAIAQLNAPAITPVQTDAMSRALESASKTIAKGSGVGNVPGVMAGRASAASSVDLYNQSALTPSLPVPGGAGVANGVVSNPTGQSSNFAFSVPATSAPSPRAEPSPITPPASPTPAPAAPARIAGGKRGKDSGAGDITLSTGGLIAATDAPNSLTISGAITTSPAAQPPPALAPDGGFDGFINYGSQIADPQGQKAANNLGVISGSGGTSILRPTSEISEMNSDRKPQALDLNGTNTYTGGTTINGGTLSVTAPAKPLVWLGDTDGGSIASAGVKLGTLADASKGVKNEGNGRGEREIDQLRGFAEQKTDLSEKKKELTESQKETVGLSTYYSDSIRPKSRAKVAEVQKSLTNADYDQSVTKSKQAMDQLQNGEHSREEFGIARDKFSEASVKLAEQRIAEGRYSDAEKTLKDVPNDPDSPHAKDAATMLSRLEQPDYYNKTITPKFRAGVEEVKEKFVEAEGLLKSGRGDLALKRSEQILSIDPYNVAARQLQEKANAASEERGAVNGEDLRAGADKDGDKAPADSTRRFEQPVNQVAAASMAEISRNDLLTRKLERIIIPKLEFKEATVREALGFLVEKSRTLDTTEPNPSNRGVNMVVKLDDRSGVPAAEAAPAAPAIPGLEALPGAAPVSSVPSAGSPADARITVSLSNIPLSEALRYVTGLAGLKYKVDPYAVSIEPATAATDSVITKEYEVRPELFANFAKNSAGAPEDATRGGAGIARREAAKDSLIANGVVFGPNASAIYVPSSGKLIVRNTQEQLDLVDTMISAGEAEMEKAGKKVEDVAAPQPPANALVPQPEVQTSANAFSTFSLNVSDVSFKLAAASLEQGKMPEPATVRTEEFINAFNYRDPEPAAGAPLAFASEQARYPFAQNRDLLRFSVKTAAAGRQAGCALNLVLLIDNSGSMERADRVRILQEALRVLSEQLQPQDKLSVVTFARTPRLWADGVAGDKAGEVTARVGEITPQGGTNIAAALDLGYATALRHYQVGSINRVVLLTDGAANLGDVNPAALKQKVEAHRKQGVALDCFGIGWEGLNDDLLEQLSRNGDGRYGFINSPEEAATEFAGQLAGALRVAASDVKVQVEFNPRRVTAYRQIGYAKHQLTKEQFRDNTVDAAEIGAAESGNALYVVEVNPRGEGDLATVRVRFKVPGTDDYREHEWSVPFTPTAPPLEQASPALRLAGTASAFSEWLVASPYAGEVTTDRLLGLLNGVPAIYGADPRPQKLEWMIRTAKSVSGR